MLKCSRQYALRRRSAAACLKPCYRPACAFPNQVKRSDRRPLFLDAASNPNGTFLAGSEAPSLSFTQPVLVWLTAS
jgi:hypothetical protein